MDTDYRPPGPLARYVSTAHCAMSCASLRLVQSAIKGRGMALGWWHVVAHELLQKGLVKGGKHELRTGDHYYLVATARRPLRKPAVLVRDWLLNEMAVLKREILAG